MNVIGVVKMKPTIVSYVKVTPDMIPTSQNWEKSVMSIPKDNIVSAISLADIDKFTMTILPDEKDLKRIYEYDFVLTSVKNNEYVFERICLN
jgi:hypothetical protein